MGSSWEQLHAMPRARLFHSALSLTQGHRQVCTGQKSSKWATTFTVQAGLSCYTYIIYNREIKRRGQSPLLTKLLSTKGHPAEKAGPTNSGHPPGSAQHTARVRSFPFMLGGCPQPASKLLEGRVMLRIPFCIFHLLTCFLNQS